MPNFEFVPINNAILANNAGLSLDPKAKCQHDEAAIGIRFFLQGDSDPERQHLDVVVPRCTMADLIGTLTTVVRLQEGDAAAEKLAHDIELGVQKATELLGPLVAAGRTCCQAGYRTNGSEHTCSKDRS